MSFFYIWDEYAAMDIIGRWLNVWQGSCQAKSGQWKSRYGMEKK
jgi:hypothetical protein